MKLCLKKKNECALMETNSLSRSKIGHWCESLFAEWFKGDFQLILHVLSELGESSILCTQVRTLWVGVKRIEKQNENK